MNAASSAAPSQWLGIECHNGCWAVVLHQVQQVFQASTSASAASVRILDIEVHAGSPIFIQPFEACFSLPGSLDTTTDDEDRRWIVVPQQAGSAMTGCRVHQVLGPFWSAPAEGHVAYDNRVWRIIQALTPSQSALQGT